VKNNKSLKVLSTAAIAAALVAPTVAVQPAFAASSYTVSGVQNAAADSQVDGPVRITVEVGAGNLINDASGNGKKFQLRLPSDSHAVLNGVKSSAEFKREGTQQVISAKVTKGVTASGVAKFEIVDKVNGTSTFDVKLSAGDATANPEVPADTSSDVAKKIAEKINAEHGGIYTAEADGAYVRVKLKEAAANDTTFKLSLKDDNGTGIAMDDSEITVPGEASDQGAYVPGTYNGTTPNQVGSVKITPRNPSSTGAAQVFDVEVKGAADAKSNKGIFYLELTNIWVPSGTTGALNATIDSEDSTFTNSDAIKIAQVGNGSVTTSIDGTVALTPGSMEKDKTLKTIRVKEDSAGAFTKGQKYKLELPDGFEWDNTVNGSSVPKVTVAFGDDSAKLQATKVDGDTIEFELVAGGGDKNSSDSPKTSKATQFAIDGLRVKVDDNDAKKGDVTVKIKGDVSRTNDSIVIGTYGTYEGEIKGADAKTVYAGQTGEELANLTIKEDAPGTLQKGRTLKLKLNGNAKWAVTEDSDGKLKLKDAPQIKNADSDKNGLSLSEWKLSGTDRTTIEATIDKPSSNKPAKLVMERLKVDVAPTAGKGDISVSVEGTTGVRTDSVILGKTVAPVEVSVDGEIAKINTGLQQQAIPNIVLKEAAADLIDKGHDLVLKFPDGVKPALPGKIEVTEGNLKIDSAKVSVSDNKIIIPVSKNSSDKGATIKLSDIKVTSYRDVPEGDLKVKVTGPAVVQSVKSSNAKNSDTGYYPFNKPEDTHVAEGTVAKVITPADKNKYAENIIFKIGSKTYTQDGKEMTMDVAPEVHPVYNRTYIPAAHFAASLNIPADKVVWNEASKTVTIFAGDKIVSATAGKKELVVNGTPVQIDAPVNYGQHTGYRVMVPYTHLALALGATVEWKADTQEIFVNKR
jgi:hypothetical protein